MAPLDLSKYDFDIELVLLMACSGIFCLISLPQLFFGISEICKMKKIQLPATTFWPSLISLISAYLMMLTVFLLAAFVMYISPHFDFSDNTDTDDGDGDEDRRVELFDEHAELPLVLAVGISMIELFYILSKADRMYY